MKQKISIIKEVAPTLLVITRTDALAVEGIGSTITQANNYLAAGADAIFPEALKTEEDYRNLSQHVNAPMLANMKEFGKTPYFTKEEFESFGYNMVIYPVTSLRVAAKTIEQVFTEILADGTQRNSLKNMQTRKELYETIHYYEYEELDQKISKTRL